MTATAFTIGSTKGLLLPPTELASGELLISGYLTRWAELDREQDRMVRGAFLESIPAFLRGHAPLVYGHKLREVLGRVVSLEEDSIGVKMVAKVNRQPESSPLRYVYEAIKNGTIRGLSAGGLFTKLARGDGTKDVLKVDLCEASVTAIPMLGSTGFEIVSEGKALEFGWTEDLGQRLDRIESRMVAAQLRAELRTLRA